jgi:hypothetical protein
MAALVATAVAAAEPLQTPAEEAPAAKKFEVVVPQRKTSLEEFQRFPEEEAEDDGEVIEPAYFYEGGGIPVFTPVCFAFRVLFPACEVAALVFGG